MGEQEPVKAPRTRPRIVAVSSGKGGVGKTNMAVNLSLSLRLLGAQVLLLDADVGLGNVDVLLGLEVRHDLRDVLLHGRPLAQTVVDGPRGLKILPGASGVEEMTSVSEERLDAFFKELADYCSAMDFVVVDTAPGISAPVLNCLMAVDELLLVTNPEPTALTDAYALLKVLSRRPGATAKRVSLIMNQTGSREEAMRSYDRLRATARQFLEWEVEYPGLGGLGRHRGGGRPAEGGLPDTLRLRPVQPGRAQAGRAVGQQRPERRLGRGPVLPPDDGSGR